MYINQVGIVGVQLQFFICAILTSCSLIFRFHGDLLTYMEYYLQYMTGNLLLASSLNSVTFERRTSEDVRDIHLILIIQCTFFSVGQKHLVGQELESFLVYLRYWTYDFHKTDCM